MASLWLHSEAKIISGRAGVTSTSFDRDIAGNKTLIKRRWDNKAVQGGETAESEHGKGSVMTTGSHFTTSETSSNFQKPQKHQI